MNPLPKLWFAPAWVFLFFLAFAGVTQFSGRPVLHERSTTRLCGFLRETPGFLGKVLDIRVNDERGALRGHEASYVTDWVDAWLFRAMHALGIRKFVSPWHWFLSAAFATILWAFGRGLVKPWGAWLGFSTGIFFLTLSPIQVQLWYDTMKISTTVLAAAILLFWWRTLESQKSPPWPLGLLGAIPSIGLCLLDERGSGVLWAALFACLFLFAATRRPLRAFSSAAAAMFAAGILFRFVYMKSLGPWLVHALHGYAVAVEAPHGPFFSDAPIQYYLIQWKSLAGILGASADLKGWFAWLFLAFVAAGSVLCGWNAGKEMRRGWRALASAAFLLPLLAVPVYLGILDVAYRRQLHLPEFWVAGVRLQYFPISILGILAVSTLFALVGWFRLHPRMFWWSTWLLGFFAISNLVTRPSTEKAFYAQARPYYDCTEIVLDRLRRGVPCTQAEFPVEVRRYDYPGLANRLQR